MLNVRLQASAELRLLLDMALDAVVVMNPDGTVAEWNDRAAALFGWTREQALGRIMADLIIPPHLRPEHRRGLQKFLQTGEGPLLGKRIEVTALRKSGEEIPVELSIAPVRDEDGIQFVGVLRDISERKRAAEQQQMLLAELDHRVKNMLSVVTAIASQTARTTASVEEFSEKFVARLQALSRAHALLTAQQWRTTVLRELIGEILAPHVPPEAERLSVEGPPVALNANKMLALTLILHELVTNATKYGAFSTAGGRVSIRWSVDGQKPRWITLTWRESGVPGVTAPKHAGFGSRLIESSARHDLGGEVTVSHQPDGIVCELKFPLPAIT